MHKGRRWNWQMSDNLALAAAPGFGQALLLLAGRWAMDCWKLAGVVGRIGQCCWLAACAFAALIILSLIHI